MKNARRSQATVLMSPGDVGPADNPFVRMLVESVQPEVKVISFTWVRAFFRRYDILHIHWPERMTSHPSPVRRGGKISVFLLLLAWNRVRGVRNVGTVHNLTPHEKGGRLENRALAQWERSCIARIFLSQHGLAGDPHGTGILIPHGDYQPFVERFSEGVVEAKHGVLLTFGYLRPYKGIESLVAKFRGQESLRLIVAGKPVSPGYAALLRDAADGSTELRMRSQGPRDLVGLISGAEAVVLPYRNIYNSGAAFLALTLGRPLIVTTSPTMLELREEVGAGWMELLPVDWKFEDVKCALEKLRDAKRERSVVAMQNRSWDQIGAAHVDLYERLKRV